MGVTALKSKLEVGYKVSFSSRDHTWMADEPIELGGGDHGPKPTELLLSALAGCKAITVKMYAKRKEWKLDSVNIDLEIIEVGQPTKVSKKISFEGDLNEDQINRLIDISGRCPVVKMLSDSISFELI
jgi:putative redox protein